MERNNFSEEQAEKRIAAQPMTNEERAARATVVISNEGTREEIVEKVGAWILSLPAGGAQDVARAIPTTFQRVDNWLVRYTDQFEVAEGCYCWTTPPVHQFAISLIHVPTPKRSLFFFFSHIP